jgi:DNA-binding GntR family transcriptional regulator
MTSISPGMPQRSADRVYESLKLMAVTYALKPGARLNEIELAKGLAVSRTPVREALNRLVTEGFLTSAPNRGFYCRPLDARQVYDLYELRCALEVAMLPLACERAGADELAALRQFALESRDEETDTHALRCLKLDERFHETLAELSHNEEFVRTLRNINGRIHFVRWIDMQQGRRRHTQAEHLAIVEALCARDAAAAASLLRRHIARRLDQIIDVIKAGFGEIYTRDPAQPQGAGRPA